MILQKTVSDQLLQVFVFVLTNLIGHDHQMTVSQRSCVFVDFLVLKTHDLFDGLDFGIFGQLLAVSISNVEQFASQREDAVVVSTDDTNAGHSERFSGVTFREDEGALVALLGASLVGVFKLGNTSNTRDTISCGGIYNMKALKLTGIA